ncbi:uncharacterized protein LOC144234466 [Crocuta crocuta]
MPCAKKDARWLCHYFTQSSNKYMTAKPHPYFTGHSKKAAAICKPGRMSLPRTQSAGILIFDFPPRTFNSEKSNPADYSVISMRRDQSGTPNKQPTMLGYH